MPEVKFGHKDESSVQFRKSENLIAVRTRSRRSATAIPVPSPISAELSGGQLVLSFPEAGVEVYQVPIGTGQRSINERKVSLRRLPDVRFAGGVLVDQESGEPVIYTENLFIKFTDTTELDDCRTIIREAGLTIKEEVGYAPNAFFVAAPEGIGEPVFEMALSLLNRDDVEYCHPELLRKRSFRAISPQQWHLKTTVVNGVTIAASANVEAAHQITQGEGITIAVIDDGVDIDHVEFRSSGKIVAPRDATQNSNDPRPKDNFYPDDHGTACAGVSCADGNFGASGVAPKAKLMPIRLASGLGSQQESNAFKWAADNGADVISCSWGPPDGQWFNPKDPMHNRRVPLPASTKLAIDYATTKGRGGKGCVVLFAAGNGNESVDNDGYASYERVIAVAACNDRGQRSVYSDFGDAVWCAFPSSDFGYAPFSHPEPLTTGIWTTDRTGNPGYNQGFITDGDPSGNYTNSFGGTSSSCPGAAGVGALVLAVNPNLRWQEVKDLFKSSCDKIDPSGGLYDGNGWSKYYGYGRLNAETAVTLAQPQPQNSVLIMRNFNQLLPDLQTVSVQLEVGETTPVKNIAVIVDIKHSYIGDLIVSLIPPVELGLNKIILHNRWGGSTDNLQQTFDVLTTPALANFQGKTVKGTWKLEVQDMAFRDEGELIKFGVELFFV
ncbi:MAG: S8 family serine peptidase [Xenococcaceae cyanobacterium MO_188.B19]|nr:S8 family serine peptidase [Xenococcaceae cyanobacterium MO_188.B19]